MRTRIDGIWGMPLSGPMTGRSRPHLSLREGLEKPPFPLALHRVGSVLAVQGSLRRFAPWTARADPKDALLTREKGGSGSASDFVSHLIAFDSIAPKTGAFGPCGRAGREPFGHTRTP